MTKNILFTGGTGLLGKYFLRHIPKGYFVYSTHTRKHASLPNIRNVTWVQLDINDKKAIGTLFKKIKPVAVIHAAGNGNVDYCETHKPEARKTNITGTKNVLRQAKKYNAQFIFTSSNAIYNGKHPPYSEKTKPSPVDYYGFTKATTESDIKLLYDNYVIIRLMTMFGWQNEQQRANPVSWIIEKLSNKQKMKIVDDIYNNYLYADDAAKTIWKIVQLQIKGKTYNLAGKECISRYELAKKVAGVFHLDESLLEAVSSDYFPSIAPRPKNTCFSTKKVQEELGYLAPSTITNLRRMKNDALRDRT